MAFFSDPLIGVEIEGKRITLAEVKIKRGRVMVLRTATEIIESKKTPAETLLLMVRALGIKRARLSIVLSADGMEHKLYKLPPMGEKAAKGYLAAKLASDLSIQQKKLVWDAPLPPRQKSRTIVQSVMSVVAHERLAESYGGLESDGLIVEALTSPGMALWSLACQVGLLQEKEALIVHIGLKKTTLVGAGALGPFFYRQANIGSHKDFENQFMQSLSTEIGHALIYLRQHLRKQVSRVILIGQNNREDEESLLDILSRSDRMSGLDITAFPADLNPVLVAVASKESSSLEDVPSEIPILTALLPLVSMRRPFVNLIRREADSRKAAKKIRLATLFAAGLLLFWVLKWGLMLGVTENQMIRRLDALKRQQVNMQEEHPEKVEADWKTVEKTARLQLIEKADLHLPSLPKLLKELALVTPKEIRFKTLSISKAGDANANKRRGRAKATGKTKKRVPWSMEISGGLKGKSYAALQKKFRQWYESLTVSPFLTHLNIQTVSMRGTRFQDKPGAARPASTGNNPASEMSYKVTSDVLTEDAVEETIADVLAKP